MNTKIKLHETVTSFRDVAEKLARQWSLGLDMSNKRIYEKEYYTMIPFKGVFKVTNKFDPRVKYYDNK